jgi:hypothetical protein
MTLRPVIALLALLLWPSLATAHKPSDSYVTISGTAAALELRWDIALRDLDQAIGLDADDDGAVTWGELRAREHAVASYAFARLMITGDGRACPIGASRLLVDRHADGTYAVLAAPLACPLPPSRLAVAYDLLFDLDPQHRGLLSVTADGSAAALVIGPDQRQVEVPLAAASPVFGSFFLDGVHHLLAGADHLLFLLVLLLPAAFGQRGPGPDGLARAILATAGILTAFTLAHAASLSAAVLGVIALPARPVEVAIAASILLTALDNLRPCLGRRRWLVAGLFGLVHGLGFANVLAPLDLPPAALAIALLAFNLGIETAQLGVVLVLLPLGQLLRHRRAAVDRVIQGAGSAAAVSIAGAWMIDRSFDLGLMPF